MTYLTVSKWNTIEWEPVTLPRLPNPTILLPWLSFCHHGDTTRGAANGGSDHIDFKNCILSSLPCMRDILFLLQTSLLHMSGYNGYTLWS